MKVSLIIAVYKDVEALSLIIESLRHQTYKNFEVVVAEDGEDEKIAELVASVNDLEVKHVTQEDLGIRKTRSLNNGILISSGEFLVFIDGDCVPYSTFLESYVKIAKEGFVFSGRRANLGPRYSNMLRNKTITSFYLERKFIANYIFIALDSKEGHTEDGFYFSPDRWIYNKILKKRNSSNSLLGCNYGCYREDMFAINGYDEGYGETAIGDDTDLEWRFKSYGLKIESVKNIANVFHLYHSRSFREKANISKYLELYSKNKNKNKFICANGLNQH